MIATCCRHAESLANAGHPTSDPLTIGLTSRGREQALKLAEAWSSPPTLIIVSGALRTQETAAPTIQRFADSPVAEWPIHEFTYLAPARCAGTTVEQRKGWVEAYWQRDDPSYCDGPAAESFQTFIRRVDACLARLAALRAYLAAPPLLFGHGQFINAMRWRLADPSNQDDMHRFRAFDSRCHLNNCDIVELRAP